MDYITILEYIGVFAFAVSGSIVAIEEEFDVFGVYIIAIITAMGGGVLRDIVSDVGIPVFFTSYMTIPFIIAGTLLAIFLKGNLKYKNLLLFIFAASITGVGGGVLRDIITNRKPQIFKNDIYCIAGVIGVTILWFIYPIIGMESAQFITLIIIVLIRMISYYKTINLPVICKERV